MDKSSILSLYAKQEQAKALAKALDTRKFTHINVDGLAGSACAVVFAAISHKVKHPLLFIMRDEDEAGYLYNDLNSLLDTPLFFPSSYKRAVKYGQRDAANEILRTEVLSALSSANESLSQQEATEKRAPIVITYPTALAEMVVTKANMSDFTLALSVSQEIDITDVQKKLHEFGFHVVDYVYEPGQYAVRGSILDVYSFNSELPFRIDFFGDEIDTIRTFEVETQLSKERKQNVEIVPELTLKNLSKEPLTEYLPDDTIIVCRDLAYVAGVIDKTYQDGFSEKALTDRLTGATEMEQEDIRREMNAQANLCPPTRFIKSVAGKKKVILKTQTQAPPQPSPGRENIDSSQLEELTSLSLPGEGRGGATIHFDTLLQPLFHKNFELLSRTIEDYQLQNYKICFVAESQKQIERIRAILEAAPHHTKGESLNEAASVRSCNTGTPPSGVGGLSLHSGFIDNQAQVCFFTDHQIFERFHKYNLKTEKARRGKMALTMKELQEMEVGDFIVHVDFGIGKFAGLVRVPTADGGYQEVIRIVYQDNAKVDVSIHSLYKISKYRRADSGEPPRLSKLGTGAWDRLKEKAKTRMKDIARDLIKLYAKRRHERGFAFSPDSYLQLELEGSFLYEDTPDQMRATSEVKHDMESQRPMDRLVCGDVGFGKTEVAIRAAFKAACDSKQVAVLVPTTVLAFQHYQNFRDRMKDLPVRVDYLSRARSAKQTREVINDLKAGKIDILVGTHKLLAKNVEWKDVGLLIIDEEQKFGVSTKEKLRQLKTNIDTLTMSATPIPRTLQFSLMGARDMSIMRTPPPNRYPIQTEVTTYSSEVICDAINFEMSRNGQVYFVNDRIKKLEDIQRMIQRHIPDCRIAVGHGQMKPEELEKIIMGFMNYDYDVLLSTTIVENGIDIPNANTIIINDAHHFGLSDLHQMRGRVGRSNRKAFCYLLAPPLSALPTDSRRRLEALETFSELGSGFSIAMQDLDIRGAGNLLGAEQSGFMEDLGYETYQKILSQAVNELKNEEFQDLFEEQINDGERLTGDDFVDDCAVESDLEMYYPDTYVPGSSERMLLYRELDNIVTDDDLVAYRKRLEDRFGPVPQQGEELMQVVLLRRFGRALGSEKITLKAGVLKMQFVSNEKSAFYRSPIFELILNFVQSHARRCEFKEVKGRRLLIVRNVDKVSTAVDVLRRMKGANE